MEDIDENIINTNSRRLSLANIPKGHVLKKINDFNRLSLEDNENINDLPILKNLDPSVEVISDCIYPENNYKNVPKENFSRHRRKGISLCTSAKMSTLTHINIAVDELKKHKHFSDCVLVHPIEVTKSENYESEKGRTIHNSDQRQSICDANVYENKLTENELVVCPPKENISTENNNSLPQHFLSSIQDHGTVNDCSELEFSQLGISDGQSLDLEINFEEENNIYKNEVANEQEEEVLDEQTHDDFTIDYLKYESVPLRTDRHSNSKNTRKSYSGFSAKGDKIGNVNRRKLSFQVSSLFQIETQEEEIKLRNSIQNTPESKSVGLGLNLLCRTGNTLIIKLIGTKLIEIDNGPIRTLWQKTPEVISEGLPSKLKKHEINLQEAIFEIFVTQMTLVNSFNVLQGHFMKCLQCADPEIITKKEYYYLFSDIEKCIPTAEELLEEMTGLWMKDKKLTSLCKLVKKSYKRHQDIYVKYSRNIENVMSHLKMLMKRKKFESFLEDLVQCKESNGLPLESFLNLPIKRTMQLPLLLRTVLKNAKNDSEHYFQYLSAARYLEKVCKNCNNELEKMKQVEEMLRLSNEMNFSEIKEPLEFIHESRFLISRAMVKPMKFHIPIFWKNLEIFLFNDLFIWGAHQNESLLIKDFCKRTELKVIHVNDHEHSMRLSMVSHNDCKSREKAFTLKFDDGADYQRWIEQLMGNERNITEFTQMVVIEQHMRKRPDELHLELGDIVFVYTEKINGWFKGETLYGARGWLQASCCEPIKSKNVRKYYEELRCKLRSLNGHISLENEESRELDI